MFVSARALVQGLSRMPMGGRVGLALGPLGFVAIGLVLRGLGQPGPVAFTAGTVFWMACWWITEPVALWATALLPLLVFPLIGAASFPRVLLQYFDPVNFLFLGGMWIAAAMEEWNLHRRLALGIVAGVGVSPRRIVLGFMLATAFISLWISNTAAALMMVPIGMAVLGRFAEQQGKDDPDHRRFGKALMLGIAYAASMGGIGSKIGTGTNLVFVKEARRSLGLEVSFLSWFKVGLPVVLLAVPLSWWYLVRVAAPLASTATAAGSETIRAERSRLGSMSAGEWVALLAFLLAALLWVFRQPMDFGLFVIPGWSEHMPFGWPELLGRPVASLPPPLAELLGPRGPESVVALLVGGALFFIPITRRPLRMALPVRRGFGIAWGLLVLLGGGFAMAEGIQASGLSRTIGASVQGLSFPAPFVGFVVICLVTIALSEVASNTATASILLPLLAASAPSLGLQPAPLMFAATLSASFGFMLPAGTPPNAVAFSSGYIKVTEMARSGLVVDLVGAVLIATVCWLLAPRALQATARTFMQTIGMQDLPSNLPLAIWRPFGQGFTIEGEALRLQAGAPGQVRGAVAIVKLGQRQVRPIAFAARSRAQDVTGEADSDYSLYVDVRYTDGSTSFGHALPFPVGTHDWQLRQGVIQPERPVDQLSVYCLLRNGHTGTVWFRDVVAREAPPDARVFDGQLVRASAALATDPATGGGLFVRDVGAGSDLVQPAGGRVPGLDLAITTRVRRQGDRTDVHVQLEDRRRSRPPNQAAPRAISLYFALPLPPGQAPWTWGDDIRRQRPVTGAFDLVDVSREWDIGAVGAVSRHPFAAVWRDGQVLMLSHPLAQPRLARIGASPAAGLLYLVFDLALSAETRRFPGRAWVDFSIHRFALDPLAAGNGFRAALARYQQQHPADFARRFPAAREGTWLPFSAKAKIDRPADFGFGVHELHDLGEVASDQQLGIAPFRYLQVPDSYAVWLDEAPRAPAGPAHDPALDAAVQARLGRQQRQGNPRQRREAEAILSSAFHDGRGRPVYRWSPAGQIPWCGGKAGCAFFAVSADPAIADRRWPLNKAHADWNAEARNSYQQHPGLAGEFVDGVQASSFRFMLDQRRAHWTVARQPLGFAAQGLTAGIPSLFATVAFVDWLAADLHGRGKLLMGNTLFEDVPWAGRAFDYLGVEVNWLRQAPGEAARFVPDDDAKMSYRRSLAGQRPYGLLMNTEFAAFAAAEAGRAVERYFQIALFYGFYPSFFSADAANAPYWENPAHVDRDRPLFRKYVPLIRRINAAGWQPLTGAASSDPALHVERFGSWPELYFTVRNTSDRPVTARLTFQPALGLPAGGLRLLPQVQPAAPTGTSTVTLAASAVEVFRVEGG